MWPDAVSSGSRQPPRPAERKFAKLPPFNVIGKVEIATKWHRWWPSQVLLASEFRKIFEVGEGSTSAAEVARRNDGDRRHARGTDDKGRGLCEKKHNFSAKALTATT